MASTEKSFLEKITDSIDGVSYKQVKNMFNKFKKGLGEGGQDAIKDTASMMQKFKKFINKITSEQKEAKSKGAKGPSQANMMGGAKGPKGPLGGKLDDPKKKKKSMMKGSSYDPRKANRAGQKMGQR